MRSYQAFESDVRRRQEVALSSACRRGLRRSAGGPPAPGARLRLAGRLRQLAAWLEGSAAPAGSVTLRPS